MLVGGSDFTLLGRPILDNNLIRVEATVVEKTLSYTKLHFRLKKRKNFRRLKCNILFLCYFLYNKIWLIRTYIQINTYCFVCFQFSKTPIPCFVSI